MFSTTLPGGDNFEMMTEFGVGSRDSHIWPLRRCQHTMGSRWFRNGAAFSPVVRLLFLDEVARMNATDTPFGGAAKNRGINNNSPIIEGDGEPDRSLRWKTWNLLRDLSSTSDLHWCVMGDMNNLLHLTEQRGGHLYPRNLMEGFAQALLDSNLTDMEMLGYQFTWERGRGSPSWIESKLDRALFTPSWAQVFTSALLHNLEFSSSDHSPLLLEPIVAPPSSQFRHFRFENAWFKEPMCLEIIKSQWAEGVNLPQKLPNCAMSLAEWGKSITGNFGRRLKEYWDHGLSDLIGEYYASLFTASNSSCPEVIDCILPSISAQQNEDLMMPVTREEVKCAVFQMHPDKSPGPDGMTPAFFQKSWSIVGDEVVRMVQNFLSFGSLEDIGKGTNMVLIPKKGNPEKLTDLRLIALCNVLYKVITKVIANRLKPMLDGIISPQESFYTRRLIRDNIMVSFEVLHYLKRKRQGKEGYMALKL
uniref:Endonuclease/exonuclease/phosphatase domain-containing protein n=1 Tax=Cannabis sativa TaxID=3483 RepID=A0A803NV32_CANSA